MKVAVVRLRKDGKALARDQLGPPAMGWLRVERWWLKNQYEERRVTTANLYCGPSNGAMPILPALNDCALTKMGGDGFLLAGFEPAEHLKDAGSRQTWWCRLVIDPPTETGP